MRFQLPSMTTFMNKKVLSFFLVLFSVVTVFAQEVIKDQPAKEMPKADSSKKMKIDGVIATIGEYIILDSDIDKAYLEISSQGGSVKDISRCQMLGKLMEDKLYAHQAVQDSVKVTDTEVKAMMDERLGYMTEQLGSMDKIVEYYKKNNEEEFRTYFFDILKENKLTSEMQKKIVDDVQITPEEVRNFFKKIPKEELPVFGAEMEVAQIVVKPKISDADKQKVIDRLNGFKKEIQEGSSFATKAVLYSQDPGSRASGGYYKMNRKTPFVKEFKDVAFSLAEGEISAPFETDFGYHIIRLIEWKAVPSFESMKKELQTKVNKDERSKKTQDSFVSKLKNNYHYQYKGDKNLKWFNQHLDSTYYIGKWSADGKLKSNKPLFVLNGERTLGYNLMSLYTSISSPL